MLRLTGGFYMIELKEMTFQSFLNNAVKKANKTNSKQLISWTNKINSVDLLSVFETAKELNKDRIFWTNSSNDFTLVGIGSVQKIIAHENRFQRLEEQWENIRKDALIYNPYEDLGTGLVSIGGMSFDPKRQKSKLWDKFPTSQLTIPEYVLTQDKDNYYLTANLHVDGNTAVEQVVNNVSQVKEMILHPSTVSHESIQKVLAKQEIEPEKWKNTVKQAVQNIKQEQVNKIVLAREMRLTLNRQANIGRMLRRLKETQPNSYIFAFEHGDNCFLGATPERLVQVKGEKLLSTCLAGTSPRGKTIAEDEKIAHALFNDPKNREEHDYVVQMIKKSIEKYCENINIPDEPVVFPLRNLQHLYTPVTARLKKEYTVFDIVKKLHPTPALGGVPRDKALAFIRENELLDRGWYGAPIGWLDSQANSEFAVALRSGLVQNDEVSLFAGCGVMRDSDPEMEYEETNVKFLPMLTILEDTDESY